MCHGGHAGFLWAERTKEVAPPYPKDSNNKHTENSVLGRDKIFCFGGWPKLCVAASVGPGKFHQHTKLEIVCQKNSHLALFWSFPVVSPLDSSSLDRKHAGEGNILYLAGAMVSCTRSCIRMFDVGEDFEFDAFDHGCFNMRKIVSTVTWGEQRLIIIGNRFNNTHG